MKLIGIKQTARNCWRVAYDGIVLGDERGYDRRGATLEAERRVRDEEFYAKRDGRPAERALDPTLYETAE